MGVRALQSFFHECIQTGESFAGIVFERWQAGECVERWHEKECLWRDGRNGNVCGETSGMGNVCGEMTGMGMCVERWQEWECVWRDGRQGRNVGCDWILLPAALVTLLEPYRRPVKA